MSLAHYVARGIVQNVMFRQTIIRAAQSRGLVAGATNDKSDRTAVFLAFQGEMNKIEALVEEMASKKKLNNWGAQVETIERVASDDAPLNYEVNTSNVDSFNWRSDVKFYI